MLGFNFKTKRIASASDLITSELIRAREEKKLTLTEAARISGIKISYLEALEKGDWSKLPAGIYVKNFLKEYAVFLDLDANKLASLYSYNAPQTGGEKNRPLFSHQIVKNRSWEIARLTKNILIGLAILASFFYLAFYLKNITSAPALTIAYPPENLVTADANLTVNGQAENETSVFVNGEEVLTDNLGYFTKDLDLKTGLNTITVSAQKKYGRRIDITREVLLKK